MKSMIFLILCAATLLAACGEKPQGLGAVKQDSPPHSGTSVSAFTAPDWKPGDKTSWEQQLRTRAQYGQNDYTRAP
jgi:hypothetical protein